MPRFGWLLALRIQMLPKVFDQPFRKISYGMLIDADTNTRTVYNGAE
jgi:hypothetical protein